MKRLGVDAYRFSIAWPRIQPDGTGAANAAGLDFYDRLVDELVEARHRADGDALPLGPAGSAADADRRGAGGWLDRTTAERFAEYAAIVAARLGDRVGKWVPVNEPNVVTLLGHGTGVHAPGQALGFDALPVAHHLNLAHGLAVQALRDNGAREVGTATNHTPVWAASDSPEDAGAVELFDALWNRIFADPMLLGSLPGRLRQS